MQFVQNVFICSPTLKVYTCTQSKQRQKQKQEIQVAYGI